MGGFTPAPIRRIIAPKPKPKPVAPRVQQEAVAVAPRGPTIAELPQDTRRAVGRRGRKATILTSSTGVSDELTLGYKTLLGG